MSEHQLVTKTVDKNTVDVFWGIGWHNWCRFFRDPQSRRLHKVGGAFVPKEYMAQFRMKKEDNAKR